MTPRELLALASSLLTRDDFGMRGVWPRAVALLGRQSLEAAMDQYWERFLPQMKHATRRTQNSCLYQFVRDRELADGVRTAWASLSSACHHHEYELSPTAPELMGWLDEVERLVGRLESAEATG